MGVAVWEADRSGENGGGQRMEVSSGLMAFSEQLKEADLARVELDSEALQFEKEKSSQILAECEEDGVERETDREDPQKVELETFKLMLDVMKGEK